MSIINDAIKKAGKDNIMQNKNVTEQSIAKEGTTSPQAISRSSKIKWTAMVTVSFFLIVSLTGAVMLYKYMLRLNTTAESDKFSVSPEIPAAHGKPRQKAAIFPVVKAKRGKGILELNGIVYGPGDKWAIINDNIVREGASLLDGKLSFIAEDFVKIERNNGEEIILNLR